MKSIIINRVVILVGFYDVLQLKKPHTQMIPTILPYNGYSTCLNNHMGSILCYITPLIINNLGGGHTHTLTHAYRCPYKSNSKKPGNTPGLKTKDFLFVFSIITKASSYS